jgi:transposase-like protein
MDTATLPTNLIEAVTYFSDETVARDFLAAQRWPNGVRCVACDSDRVGYINSKKFPLWYCKACGERFSVKKGTIFEDSPIPLAKWLPAVWLYTAGKKGRSSHELARDLGVTQKTAWFMSHRIRVALNIPGDDDPFSGEVEADETLVGGKEKFKHADKKRPQPWGQLGKVAVMGLLERHGEGATRVRAKVISSRRKGIVQAEVRRNVEPGSRLYADAFGSYEGLAADYIHGVVDHSEKYVEGRIHTNGLENFWSLFKRCIYGTHHSVHPLHLDRYIDETAYRFNSRGQSDTDRFADATRRTHGKRLTWKELTASQAWRFGW